MGLFRTILHFVTFGIVDSNKELKRKSTPCVFSPPLTQEHFHQLAIMVAKRIKRLSVTVVDQIVYGEVRTQSGISTWDFCLDFNDYGLVTGQYWVIHRGNLDSSIPDSFAQQLQNEIRLFLNSCKG